MNCTEKRMQMMYQLIEDLDDQVEMAVDTAVRSKNPVDGYRNAVERIEESFEGMNAPFIVGSIKDMLLRILNARVGILMRKAEEKNDCEKTRNVTGASNAFQTKHTLQASWLSDAGARYKENL